MSATGQTTTAKAPSLQDRLARTMTEANELASRLRVALASVSVVINTQDAGKRAGLLDGIQVVLEDGLPHAEEIVRSLDRLGIDLYQTLEGPQSGRSAKRRPGGQSGVPTPTLEPAPSSRCRIITLPTPEEGSRSTGQGEGDIT